MAFPMEKLVNAKIFSHGYDLDQELKEEYFRYTMMKKDACERAKQRNLKESEKAQHTDFRMMIATYALFLKQSFKIRVITSIQCPSHSHSVTNTQSQHD